PIRSPDGKLLGVLNSEITLADISAYLGQLRVGKAGKSFIMERDGQLIANSVGLDCMTPDLKRVSAAALPDKWIAAAATNIQAKAGNLANTFQSSMIIDKEPLRVVATPFSNRRNLNWQIVTLAPDNDFLADIRANRNRSIWFGL